MIKPRAGFTIVELLIVIVVIAILAAISVVAYTGIQNRATESSIKADLTQAHKKFMIYHVDKVRYPTNSDMALNEVGLKLAINQYTQTLYCAAGNGVNYALLARSTGGTIYIIGSNRELSTYTAYPITSHTDICTDIFGAVNARYGYDTVANNWRSWVQQ